MKIKVNDYWSKTALNYIGCANLPSVAYSVQNILTH